MHAGQLLPGNTRLVLKFSHALCIQSRTQNRKQNTNSHAHTHTHIDKHTLSQLVREYTSYSVSVSLEVEIVVNNFYDRQKVYHLPRYTLLLQCGCVCVGRVLRCEYMCECKFTPDSLLCMFFQYSSKIIANSVWKKYIILIGFQIGQRSLVRVEVKFLNMPGK